MNVQNYRPQISIFAYVAGEAAKFSTYVYFFETVFNIFSGLDYTSGAKKAALSFTACLVFKGLSDKISSTEKKFTKFLIKGILVVNTVHLVAKNALGLDSIALSIVLTGGGYLGFQLWNAVADQIASEALMKPLEVKWAGQRK